MYNLNSNYLFIKLISHFQFYTKKKKKKLLEFSINYKFYDFMIIKCIYIFLIF